MAVLEVPVNPRVLVWARESIGLTRDEAAKEIKVFPRELEMFEEGNLSVPLDKLEKMADVYDRPLLALLAPEPILDEPRLRDFRLLSDGRNRPWSPALHRAFRRILGQREVMQELAEYQEIDPPTVEVPIGLDSDPEQAADLIRLWLDARAGVNPALRDPARAIFEMWARIIEDRGVLVTQVPGIPVEEMRGFSLDNRPYPAVALNSADATVAKNFTLMHELTHILLHRSGLCDLEETSLGHPRTESERIELFCNRVSAAILMPRDALYGLDVVQRAHQNTQWTDVDLSNLSFLFGVSQEALLLRLVTLEKASWEFYWRKRLELRRPLTEEQRPRFGNYYRNRVRHLGRKYIGTVLEAFDRGDISPSEVSNYLGVRFVNVPNLRNWLAENP